MVFHPKQISAAEAERLMQFPPDLVLWNAFLWSSWSSWMAAMGFDPLVWQRMWMGELAYPTDTSQAAPAAAKDEIIRDLAPEGDLTPPNFA